MRNGSFGMAAPDYEETEIQDLLQPPPQPVGIIKQQGNCHPTSVLKTSNSTKSNQLSVTILDLGQTSYSDNEDQKSFLSNVSTSGIDLQTNTSANDERRGSLGSQKEGYYGGKSFSVKLYFKYLTWTKTIV